MMAPEKKKLWEYRGSAQIPVPEIHRGQTVVKQKIVQTTNT